MFSKRKRKSAKAPVPVNEQVTREFAATGPASYPTASNPRILDLMARPSVVMLCGDGITERRSISSGYAEFNVMRLTA